MEWILPGFWAQSCDAGQVMNDAAGPWIVLNHGEILQRKEKELYHAEGPIHAYSLQRRHVDGFAGK